MVRLTLPLFGLETIALPPPPPPPPPPPVVSSSPPQAATPRASARAAIAAISARSRAFLLMTRFLLRSFSIRESSLRPSRLQAQPRRREQPLDPSQHQFEGQRHQRDEDRPGEDALVAVDVAGDDEVAQREDAHERSDRRRR